MTFNSIEFILFLVVFSTLWPYLRRKNESRLLAISLFSVFFIGWWNWRWALLFLSLAGVTYTGGVLMLRFPRRSRAFLVLGCGLPLAALGLFKYFGFFARAIADLTGLKAPGAEAPFDLVLPIGISFYTFMAISYLVDLRRGKTAPARSFLHYMAYLSLFAHLVAGPIVRARDLLPQILGPGDFNSENRWIGCKLMVQGFVKKILIADNLAPVVNQCFRLPPSDCGGFFWWGATGFFAVQIYCDFSGYTDIARGIARWMGYRFPRNFDRPYLAVGFREFWSRWHITLSSWFRDYVYIPLGGSRKGKLRTVVNLWTTMLLAGLWHGANWTFMAWGALHALFISVEHLLAGRRAFRADTAFKRYVAGLLTLLGVVAGWVFFRATSIESALGILREMFFPFTAGADRLLVMMTPAAWFALTCFMVWQPLASSWRSARCRIGIGYRNALETLTAATGIYACIFLRGSGNLFIYFQF
jgi:D-alanyl-lipoteichoic acid acyltransferase DltB (MBOAT superfamily)